MKLNLLLKIITCTFLFMGCTKSSFYDDDKIHVGDGNSGDEKELFLNAYINGNSGIKSWEDGNSLGLFLTENNNINNSYLNDPNNRNIKAQFLSDEFFLTPIIKLRNERGYIYAYHPYNEKTTNEFIDIETESQTDYMWGTHSKGQYYVNNKNNIANISMYHALSLVQCYIKKSNFPFKVKLSKIEIRKKDNTKLVTKGILNITNGNIKSTEYGVYKKNDLDMSITDNYTDENSVNIVVFPLLINSSNIEIVFTINDKEYAYTVDNGTAWKEGFKSVYNINYKGEYVEIDNVSIKQWESVFISLN